jgi:hypothetical protein
MLYGGNDSFAPTGAVQMTNHLVEIPPLVNSSGMNPFTNSNRSIVQTPALSGISTTSSVTPIIQTAQNVNNETSLLSSQHNYPLPSWVQSKSSGKLDRLVGKAPNSTFVYRETAIIPTLQPSLPPNSLHLPHSSSLDESPRSSSLTQLSDFPLGNASGVIHPQPNSPISNPHQKLRNGTISPHTLPIGFVPIPNSLFPPDYPIVTVIKSQKVKVDAFSTTHVSIDYIRWSIQPSNPLLAGVLNVNGGKFSGDIEKNILEGNGIGKSNSFGVKKGQIVKPKCPKIDESLFTQFIKLILDKYDPSSYKFYSMLYNITYPTQALIYAKTRQETDLMGRTTQQYLFDSVEVEL